MILQCFLVIVLFIISKSNILVGSGNTFLISQCTYGENRDAFILKFNSDGERLWATYYGGNDSDEGNSICTDNLNNVYIIGETQSTDFPTLSLTGAYNQATLGDTLDVFILKFDSNGVRQWATYYGGSELDRGFDVCTDSSNNLYVSGETQSTYADHRA